MLHIQNIIPHHIKIIQKIRCAKFKIDQYNLIKTELRMSYLPHIITSENRWLPKHRSIL